MKTQLKRLLALNLALILLLCAVFPASAAGTAAQPAADAQPQQTAQPTEDSTNRRPPHPTLVRTPSPSMAKPAPSARNGNLE